MQKTAVKPQYGWAWPRREDVGEPGLVVRVFGTYDGWLRVSDGTPPQARTIITIR